MVESRRERIGIAWVALLTTFAAGLRADEPKLDGDLKKLQGKWTVSSGSGGDAEYDFDDKTLKIKGSARSYTMTIALKTDAKPEKTIDFKIDAGPDDAKGQTCLGIYKFVGDESFVFCLRLDGARPSAYEQIGSEQFLSTLKRKKAAADKDKTASDVPKPNSFEARDPQSPRAQRPH